MQRYLSHGLPDNNSVSYLTFCVYGPKRMKKLVISSFCALVFPRFFPLVCVQRKGPAKLVLIREIVILLSEQKA